MHWFASPYELLRPFASIKASQRATVTQQRELVTTGEVGSLPVDNHITLQWHYDMIPRLLELAYCNGLFFLKHTDDKGDHILVGDEYNITGIIDWVFASTECKAYAFSSPCMMWSVPAYYEGKNVLSPEELQFADMFKARGREDMAEVVLDGRKSQRFLFNTGGAASSREEFVALFQGLREMLAVEEDESVESYDKWRKKATVKYRKGDADLERLLREDQYSEW